MLTEFLIEGWGDGSAVMLAALAEDGVGSQHPCLLLRHEGWSLDTSTHAGQLTMLHNLATRGLMPSPGI